MTGDHMKIFGSILAAAGMFLASCSSTDLDKDWDSQPDKATVESAKEAAGGQASQDSSILANQKLDGQKSQFLKKTYLSNARKLEADLKYEAAKRELLKAQELVPGDKEVEALLAQVLEQLGERAGVVEHHGQAMAKSERARLDMLKLEAETAYEKAKEHLSYKEYDKAIQKLREVQMHIKWGKATKVEYGDLEKLTDQLLFATQREKREVLATERQRMEKATFSKLREQEEKTRHQKELKINTIFKVALRKYKFEDFEGVSDMAEEILVLDPTHKEARKLFDLAEKAVRERHNREYITKRHQEFRKWRNTNLDTRTPNTDVLVKPSRRHWADISNKRKGMMDLGLADVVDPADSALQKKLDLEKLKGDFPEGTAFMDVVNYMMTVTGLPILLRPAAAEAVDSDATEVQMQLNNPITARSFLDLLMGFSENLTYIIQDGVIYITTKDAAVGNKIVRVHDISDLAFGLTSFAPPKIDSLNLGEGDDDESGPMGGPVGDPVKTVEPDELVNMIKSTIGTPGTWEAEGVNIEAMGNQMIVVHTPAIQRKVIQYLNELRKYATSIVHIESKFLTISENWLQEVGVEMRGLGGEGDNPAEGEAQLDDLTQGLDNNTSLGYDNSGSGVANDPAAHPTAGLFMNEGADGDARARTENIFGSALGEVLTTKGGASIGLSILDDIQMRFLIRMVEKNISFQLVNSQVLAVMNTQRANVTMVEQVSYVKDFEVEVAQAAFIADPVVDILQSGIVLDVKPTISWCRKYITLELRPTVAELIQPIPTFTSSLAGATLAVTMQLPELNVRTANTTVKVPDGGTVLIGGLKEIRNHERKAEVPWLSQLPIISLFFKTEGQSEEAQSLMIMVRASITDVSEVMERYERN